MACRSRVLLLLALLLCVITPAAAGLLAPGDPAPKFTFPELATGKIRTLAEIAQGQPLLLVFLETACRSCVREMVAIKRIQADRPGFAVLGVFLDINPRNVEGYVADYDLPFSFTWDGAYTMADAYGVAASPTSFLIDQDGKVAVVYPGFTLATEGRLRADLEMLLFRR